MSETKLYGIQKADGTILEDEFPDLWLERNSDALKSGLRPGETIVPIVILSADRLRALESLVQAADRMLKGAADLREMLSECHGGLCQCRKCKVDGLLAVAISDYDTQRAAVGEIEEE